MQYFYGVYLKSTGLSTTLDLVRFLSEPESVRFSHITLRGPNQIKLSKTYLHRVREDKRYDWRILLVKPGQFLDNGQSTVFIDVNLGSLTPLLSKPDFPQAQPHLTLYDGEDRRFAEQLFDLLSEYDWNIRAEVTELKKIEKKQKVDEVFLSFYMAFEDTFRRTVGDPEQISMMRNVSAEQRVQLIRKVLASFRPESLKNLQRA